MTQAGFIIGTLSRALARATRPLHTRGWQARGTPSLEPCQRGQPLCNPLRVTFLNWTKGDMSILEKGVTFLICVDT